MSDMAVNIALRQALKQGKFELKDKELQEKL